MEGEAKGSQLAKCLACGIEVAPTAGQQYGPDGCDRQLAVFIPCASGSRP